MHRAVLNGAAGNAICQYMSLQHWSAHGRCCPTSCKPAGMQQSTKTFGTSRAMEDALVEVGVGVRLIVRHWVPCVVLHLLGTLVVALVLLKLHGPRRVFELMCICRTTQDDERDAVAQPNSQLGRQLQPACVDKRCV